MMEDNIIDVNIENKFYTLEEVSKITNIDSFKISFYSEKLGDILKINEVGMYQVFDDVDIKNINTIKKLESEGRSVSQIRNYLLKNKSEVLVEKSIEPTEKDFLDFFVEVMHKQTLKIDDVIKSNKEMVDMFQKIIDSKILLPPSNEELIKEVSITIDSKIDALKEDISSSNEELTKDVKYIKERLHTAYVTTEEIEKSKWKDPKESKLGKFLRWLSN